MNDAVLMLAALATVLWTLAAGFLLAQGSEGVLAEWQAPGGPSRE